MSKALKSQRKRVSAFPISYFLFPVLLQYFAIQVRELLHDFFGKEPNTSVDADEAIAAGVAIQGM